jgi:hypothetical protein
MIVRELIKVLPEPYFAAPGVHMGTLYEIDVGTYRDTVSESISLEGSEGGGGVATYAPPKPTLTLEPQLPNQDVYEVRIYDSRRNRRLVAAIEIVSPSNKDRPETRSTFVSKVAVLLQHDICVSIVDVVSTSNFNLYARSGIELRRNLRNPQDQVTALRQTQGRHSPVPRQLFLDIEPQLLKIKRRRYFDSTRAAQRRVRSYLFLFPSNPQEILLCHLIPFRPFAPFVSPAEASVPPRTRLSGATCLFARSSIGPMSPRNSFSPRIELPG